MKTNNQRHEDCEQLASWLTRKAVSALVGLTPKTLIRLESNCQFPRPAKLPNGRVRYIRSEVSAWMNQQAEARQNDSVPHQEPTPSISRSP